jgi:hypothetical protein
MNISRNRLKTREKADETCSSSFLEPIFRICYFEYHFKRPSSTDITIITATRMYIRL